MRIVEIVGDSYAGGWIDVILSGFRARGHEVALVVPGEGPLVERARMMDIPLFFRRLPAIRAVRQILAYVEEVASWLKNWRAEVAHMHLFPGCLWGRMAAWRARVPVRATQWPGPLPLEISSSRRIDYATSWMDTALIGGCERVRQYYAGRLLTWRKAYCVHYPFEMTSFDPALDGLPVRQELGIPRDALVVSLVAYLYPPFTRSQVRRAPHLGGGGIKGHETLLKAASFVRVKRPDARFLIVGDGLRPDQRDSYPATLRRMAVELGLGDRVTFTGFRKDVARILAATDIPVVPSLTENLGGAVEPLLMEKPVVASRVGGLPDVVQDGISGFLVPPRDPVALASAILRLASLPAGVRREWGRRGRIRTLELCDREKCIMALEDIFHKQLERRQNR